MGAPDSKIVTVAPATVGSPTMASALVCSFPSAMILRFVGSTPGRGSFTSSCFPRMV